MTSRRLAVVSHPCVLPVNQSVYGELARNGWDPVLVVPDRWQNQYGGGWLAPRPLPGLEGRLIPLPVMLPGRQQRHVYRTRPARLLRSLRPDVLFVEAEPFSIPALQWGLAAARAGIPFGVQAAENRDRDLPLPARRIRSWVLRRAAFVAARSPAAAELARGQGATGAVGVAPHAVPGWEAPAAPSREVFTIGFAGLLAPAKGVRELVQAAALLGGRTRLLLVGEGPLRDELERSASPGVVVSTMGGVSHERMPEAYAHMDVLVLPSRTTPHGTAEQFGRVLVEALWCGVPVVGSDAGEIPWVIGVTGGGLVVPEGDVAALARVLARLRERPDERADLARRGREAVERLFSVEAGAAALGRLLEEAA